VSEGYRHIQRSPLCLIVYLTAAGLFAAAWVPGTPAVVGYVLVASAVTTAMLAAGFHHLAIMDEGDQLRIQFGPLPLFATTIRYNEITALGRDRTTIMEGWGIQKSFRGGWVWSIWGRDCVAVHHHGVTRVGTDDIDNLLGFLSQRTGIAPS
jgi:hypothetical protein